MSTLIIGLGNPGGEYAYTRHNVGWMCLEKLQRRGRFARERREGQTRLQEGQIEGYDLILARPQTYMNESGRAGSHLVQKFGIPVNDVLVVHDDADLRFGQIRIRRGGSAAGQKGVQSLIDSWRNPDFIRVRIGIGHGAGDDLVDHVLDRFTPVEKEQLGEILDRACDAVMAVVKEGLESAMNLYNRRPAANA